MKRILVLGAGGSASTNFIRSLRMSKDKIYIVGTDSNMFYLKRAEVNERYLVPRADSPDYIPTLNKIIKKEGIEFIHAQNDAEVSVISENRELLNTKTFLPPKDVVKICQDKWESRKLWEKDGIQKPETYLINYVNDVEKIKGKRWIRDIKGAGGKGSFQTSSDDEAFNWVSQNRGFGHYTVAEYLSDRSTTFTTVWKDGVLYCGQGRKRIYWELGPAFQSGVSGATGGGQIDNDGVVAKMSLRAIKAIDPSPHGIYSVDLTYGQDGIPYPTEINIGRFFTTHLFFAKAGLNVAYIYTQLAYNEPIDPLPINRLYNDLVWIRGLDFEPIMTTIGKVNESVSRSIE